MPWIGMLDDKGALDTTFGGGSVVIDKLAPSQYSVGATLMRDGDIVLATHMNLADNDIAIGLTRLDGAGNVRKAFGTGGIALFPLTVGATSACSVSCPPARSTSRSATTVRSPRWRPCPSAR